MFSGVDPTPAYPSLSTSLHLLIYFMYFSISSQKIFTEYNEDNKVVALGHSSGNTYLLAPYQMPTRSNDHLAVFISADGRTAAPMSKAPDILKPYYTRLKI